MPTTIEEKVATLNEKVEHLIEENKQTRQDVREIRDVFLQAKGAKWLVITMAAVAGFISAKLVPFFQSLGFK